MERQKKALCSYCKRPMIKYRQTIDSIIFICVNPECLSSWMNTIDTKISNIEKLILKKEFLSQTNLSQEEIDYSKELEAYEEIKTLPPIFPDKEKITQIKLALSNKNNENQKDASHSSIKENLSIPKDISIQYSSWVERKKPDFGWEFEFGSNWLRWIGVGAILLAFFLLISWSSQFVNISRETIEIMIFATILSSGIILHFLSLHLNEQHSKRNSFTIMLSQSLAFLSMGIYFLCLFTLRFHPGNPFYQVESIYLILMCLLVLIIFMTGRKIDSNLILIEGQSVGLWTVWHFSSQIQNSNDTLGRLPVDLILYSIIIFVSVCYFVAYERKSLSLAITSEIFPLLIIILPNSSVLLRNLNFLTQINYTLVILSFSCILCLLITITFHSESDSIFWGTIKRHHLSTVSLLPIFLSYYLLYSSLISILGFITLYTVFVSVFIFYSSIHTDLRVRIVLPIYLQLLWFVPEIADKLQNYQILPGINSLTLILLFQVIIVWNVIISSEKDDFSKLWNGISGKEVQWLAISMIVIIGLLAQQSFIDSSLYFSLIVAFPLLGLVKTKRLIEFPDYPEFVLSLSDILTYISMFFYILLVTNDRISIIIPFLGFVYFPAVLIISQRRTSELQQENYFRKIYPVINTVYLGYLFTVLLYQDIIKDAAINMRMLTSLFQLSITEIQNILSLMMFSLTMILSLLSIHYFRKDTEHFGVKFILLSFFPVLLILFISSHLISASTTEIFHLLVWIYFFVSWSLLKGNTTRELELRQEKFILIPVFALIQYSGIFLLLGNENSGVLFIGLLMNILVPFVIAFLILNYSDISELFDNYFMTSSFIVTIFLIISVEIYSRTPQQDKLIVNLLFLTSFIIFIFSRFLETDFRKTLTRVLPIINTKIIRKEESNGETNLTKFRLFTIFTFLINTVSFYSYSDKYQLIPLLITLDFIIIISLLTMQNRFLTIKVFNIYWLILFLRLLISGTDVSTQLIYLILGILLQITIHGILLFQGNFTEKLKIIFLNKRMTLKGVKNRLEGSYQLTSLLNPIFFYIFSFLLISLILRELKVPKVSAFDLLIIISLILLSYTVFLSRYNVSRYICEGGLLVNLILAVLYSFYNVETIYIIAAITAFHTILYGFWNNQQGWRITGLGIIGYTLLYGSINLIQISDDLIKIVGLGLLGIFSLLIGVIYSKFSELFKEAEKHESITQ